MGEPIKIVVVAETQDAAAKLQDFVQKSGSDLTSSLKQAAKHSGELTSGLMGNRMALMELGHVGRATAESLAFGISPLKVLALESPRIIQATTMMGLSLSAMLPWVLGIGAAVGGGALAWTAYMSGVEDTTQKTKDLIAELNKIPATLEKIQTLQKAGLMSPAAANEAADILSGKKKMYVGPDGKPTFDATSKVTEQNVTQAGMVAFSTAGREVERQNELIPVGDPRLREQAESLKPNVADEQVKGKLKLMELDREANEAAMSHIEKEIAAVHDQYEKKRQEMYLAAQQAGGLIGPHQLKSAQQDDIAKFDQAEANEIAKIRETAALAQAQKQNQVVLRAEADKNRMVLEQDQRLNTALENYATQTTAKTKAYWDEVYRAKYANAKDELDRELITQDQFDQKIAEANKENLAGYKAVNAEKGHTLELNQEIARAEIEGKLAAIQGDPFKNNSEKAQQSIPLYQDLLRQNSSAITDLSGQYSQTSDEAAQFEIKKKIADITEQQIQLEQKLHQAQGQGSWQGAYTQNLIALQNQWQSLSISLTNGAFAMIQQGVQGMANALTSMIMGTRSAGAAFAQFGMQMMTSFIEMVLEAILWAEVAIPILTALGVLSGGSTAAAGAPATIAAVSAGIVGVGAVMAATGGLITGPGTGTSDSIPAMLSHGEYVINAHAVRRFGVDNLHQINDGIQHRDDALAGSAGSGRASGRASAAAYGEAAAPKTDVVFFMDRSAMLDHLKSSDAEKIIVAHVGANKMKLGIQT